MKEIKVLYKIPTNHTMHAVNGAFGGINEKAGIDISFFYQRTAIPENVLITYDELKEQVVSQEQLKNHDVVRQIITSISLDLKSAKSIHKWIESKIEELESKLKEAKQINNDDLSR